jgi:hypothetical protein
MQGTRLRNLEEAEAQYLEMLRKAHPDLAVKVHCTEKKDSHARKKEWRPKPTKDDGTASVRTNMLFVLPPEFYAPDCKELPDRKELPAQLLSSSSVARARTLSCSGGIGFMPTVASLL